MMSIKDFIDSSIEDNKLTKVSGYGPGESGCNDLTGDTHSKSYSGGEWSEWSTNPIKQKAIEYYGMQEMV